LSAGTKRPWAEAMAIGVRLANELAVVCTRIKLAGSLRRRRPEVGDIEIVAELGDVPVDLIGAMGPDIEGAHSIARTWGNVMKSGDRSIQVVLPDGMQVDVHLVVGLTCDGCGFRVPAATRSDTPLRCPSCSGAAFTGNCWGSQLAIRTGPVDLGVEVMQRLRKRGFQHAQGRIVRMEDGGVIPTPDEETYFALAGLPCLPPEQRDTPAALKPAKQAKAAAPAPALEPAAAEPAPSEPPAAVPTSADELPPLLGALLLVDVANAANRIFYAMGAARSLAQLPERFAALLKAAIRRWSPEHVVLAIDSDSFRREAIPGFKADREGDREGPSTRAMIETLRPAFAAWKVATREAAGMEADDVIATLAANAVARRVPVLILSRDSDLLQLVSDEHQVRILWPGDRGAEQQLDESRVADYLRGHKDFARAFPPARILDLRVLAGGKDNLPRVEGPHEGKRPWGFTTKRAAELLAAGASLDTLDGEHATLLTERERGWWDASREQALQRRDALRLRSDLTLSGDGHTNVGKLLIGAPVTSVGAPKPKKLDRCCEPDCGAEIPYEEAYAGVNRCASCAGRYGRVYADQVNAGRSTACQHCGNPLDTGAMLHGDGETCTQCGLRLAAGRPVAA